MSVELANTRRATVGISDVPLVLFSPRRVFARVEDVPAYGWSLVLLLTVLTLIGYATVQTGLIDREVDRRVQAGIAELEREQFDIVERSALIKMIEDKRQEGEFLRLMNRVKVIVARPVGALASVLLLSAFFYGIVALTGKKPEWHTLLTICIFASFVDVVALVVRLGFMLKMHTLEVETSLAPLARFMVAPGDAGGQSAVALSGMLSVLDPFRIWFWLMIMVGLTVTSQLRGWKVWVSCTLLWLAGGAVRTGLAFT